MTDKSTISDGAIFKATGHPWKHWLEIFALMDAKSLPHKEIAAKLFSDHKVPSWWCQMLTVKFEQEIGRRKPGDSYDGFRTGVSATLDGNLDAVYKRWKVSLNHRKEFNHIAISAPPSMSQTDNWRYWKLSLEDETRVNVNISQKSEGKVLLQIEHSKLLNEASGEKWKLFWKSIIDDIFKK